MLHDRILVEVDREAGERRSSGGIVIPATAAMGARRLAWSRVVAVGPHARSVEIGDQVLFDPEDKSEVEVNGETYVLMRERDVHAVAAERLEGDGESTGYLGLPRRSSAFASLQVATHPGGQQHQGGRSCLRSSDRPWWSRAAVSQQPAPWGCLGCL